MKKLKRCRTKFCRHIVMPSGHSPFCSRCKSRNFRKDHPIQAHFADLRNRAKQRRHDFTLTFEQYEHFWKTGGYAEKHGKTKESLSIHRKSNDHGYHFWNVEAITLSENSRQRYVPYFKNKAQEEAALAQTQREIAEAYPELVK